MTRPWPNQNGVTLLLVLWVLVLLTVISGEFCRAMRTEMNITRNDKEATQAYYAAVGGSNLALCRILDTITVSTPPAVDPDLDEGHVDWRVNVAIPTLSVGEGSATIRIDNEAGKVNINLAEAPLLRIMLGGFELSEKEKSVIVDSILDWRDADDHHHLNGAENAYYQALPTPYACKNGDFETIDELLRVRGITRDLFDQGLGRIVTVYPDRQTATKAMGWRPNRKPEKGEVDFSKININAAAPELLMALPGFDAAAVEAVVAYRSEKDIRIASDLLKVVGTKAYTNSRNLITFELSPVFRITSRGRHPDSGASRGVVAVVHVDKKSSTPYHMIQWLDRIVTNP
jgi:general secretion pathway protein K